MEPLYIRGAGDAMRPVLLLGMDVASLSRFGEVVAAPVVPPGLKRRAVLSFSQGPAKRARIDDRTSSPVTAPSSIFDRSDAPSTELSSSARASSVGSDAVKLPLPEPREEEPALREALDLLRAADGEPGDEARKIARRTAIWRMRHSNTLVGSQPVHLCFHPDYFEVREMPSSALTAQAERIALCALLPAADLGRLRDPVLCVYRAR